MFKVGDVVIGNRKNNYNLTGRGKKVKVVQLLGDGEMIVSLIDGKKTGETFDVDINKFDKYDGTKAEADDKDTVLVQIYQSSIDVRNLKTSALIESVDSLVLGNVQLISSTPGLIKLKGIPQQGLTKEFIRMLTHPVMRMNEPKSNNSMFIPYSLVKPNKQDLVLLELDGYYTFDSPFNLNGGSIELIKDILGYN